jgi:hypothetical protein
MECRRNRIKIYKINELGTKNKEKEYKKETEKNYAAKTITKGFNSRAKLSKADSYLQKKKETN